MWLVWALILTSLSLGLLAFLVLFDAARIWPAIILGPATSIAAATLLERATRGWKVQFDSDCALVGDLARFVAARTPTPEQDARADWNRDQISEVVHALTVQELGVKEFTDDTRFAGDLDPD